MSEMDAGSGFRPNGRPRYYKDGKFELPAKAGFNRFVTLSEADLGFDCLREVNDDNL